MLYKVTSSISRHGRIYRPGESIDLPDAEVPRLLRHGAIASVEVAVEQSPALEPVVEPGPEPDLVPGSASVDVVSLPTAEPERVALVADELPAEPPPIRLPSPDPLEVAVEAIAPTPPPAPSKPDLDLLKRTELLRMAGRRGKLTMTNAELRAMLARELA